MNNNKSKTLETVCEFASILNNTWNNNEKDKIEISMARTIRKKMENTDWARQYRENWRYITRSQ